MSEDTKSKKHWQQTGLDGLATLTVEAMPGVEVLLLDDIASYVMGSGPLEPPFTVEHGTRVASALFGAIVNAPDYATVEAPAPTPEIENSRTHFVKGAHDFAAHGAGGLTQLVNRLIPAVVGELERHKDAPEQQTCSLFYYAMLAVASGPQNMLAQDAAEGMMDIFRAWDDEFGAGFVVPWRR
ncbi:MAG: hypothetical protein ACXVXJ_12645 [Mycobacteriaceae bacterium]